VVAAGLSSDQSHSPGPEDAARSSRTRTPAAGQLPAMSSTWVEIELTASPP